MIKATSQTEVKEEHIQKILESKSAILLRDVYSVIPGFVYVIIYRDEKEGVLVYNVVEPPLTDEDVKNLELIGEFVRDIIMKDRKILDDVLTGRTSFPEERLERYVKDAIKKLKLDIPDSVLRKYMYYIMRDVVGFGKLDPLMRDPYIEDINVNGPGRYVYVWHSYYEHLRTNVKFETAEEIYNYIVKISQIVKRNVSSANPILEGLIGNFARVEAALSDIAPLGHCINIRKFRTEPFTIVDLIKAGTISAEAAAYLWTVIDYKFNVVIIGPTGSGKTTLLNSLLYLIRPEVRIVTIEDTREINIPHEQWVPLLTRPSFNPQVREITQFDLIKVSMRIRPDYLVIGEIRGEEAYALFQAFASGHAGLTTLHADTVEAAIMRLTTKPMNVPKRLLRMAHVFCNIQRVRIFDRIVRRVIEIKEFRGFENGKPRFITPYKYNPLTDRVEKYEESELLKEIAEVRLVPYENLINEVQRRKEILEAMARYNFRDPATVFRIFRSYHINPEDTYFKVISGVIP